MAYKQKGWSAFTNKDAEGDKKMIRPKWGVGDDSGDFDKKKKKYIKKHIGPDKNELTEEDHKWIDDKVLSNMNEENRNKRGKVNEGSKKTSSYHQPPGRKI